MNKHRLILRTVLLVLLAGVHTPQFAQDTSTDPVKTEQARRRLAIGLLRTMNTAEVNYRIKNGSYGMWTPLITDQSEMFNKFLALLVQKGLLNPGVRFADAPEVLPGWNLRLNVHPDGQGYDLLLRDLTDQKCGYAALTDESGVIRQSKAIDCEI